MNYYSRPAVDYCKKSKEKTIELVCSHFDLPISQVFIESRIRKIVDARSIIMYICHKHLEMTCTEVGKMFKKDHATVLHACKKIAGFMDIDKSYKELVNSFK